MAAVSTAPAPPVGAVRRVRLEDRLDVGVRGPLTLVVAPAGTGKTVLASSWASAPRAPGTLVWLSLDEDAVRPRTFRRLLLAGLAGEGVVVPPALSREDGQEPSFVAAVADGVMAHRSPVVLVLDCDAALPPEVTADLDGLLRRAGGRLRVVLLAREDPLLPLHRYRLADAVVELRMADLAFTADEARAVLAGAGVSLSPSALDATMSRTQGWAAGLCMAAMYLSHHAEHEQAARRFAGDTGTVAEYLLAEVLDTQPDGVRRLLLDTSVVDVLRPGLASALAGPHAERALSFLVHGNAFLSELSELPGHYRYHDLFRELLRAQLAYESPARAVALHRVAAQWFAEHGLVVDAVRHCVQIRDWETAARCAVDDLSVPMLRPTPQSEALHQALAKVPESDDGTAVAVVSAARAVAAGDWTGAVSRLSRAHELLDASAAGSWPAAELALAVTELVRASHTGDADAALQSATTARDLLSAQDPGRLAAHPEIAVLVQTCRGAALVLAGHPEEAAGAFASATASSDAGGTDCVVGHALAHGALLAALRGDLTLSADLAARALLPASVAEPVAGGAAEAALAYVHAERYELRRGRQHAERATGLGPTPTDTLPMVVLALARARILRAAGDLRAALAVLDDVRTAGAMPGWLADVVGLEAVAVLAAQGESGRAAELARQLGDASGPPAGAALDGAGRGRSAPSAPPGSWVPTQRARPPARIDELVQAAARHARDGRTSPAVQDLEHALRLAAPEHSRRAFHEAPAELWRLLREHDELFVRHAWLTDGDTDGGGGGTDASRRLPQRLPVHRAPAAPEPGLIYEPLTDKEREVLTHLSDLLSTQEIAATMFISVNTVRTHVRNILRKLAASRRNEAVRRARQLGVIADDQR